MLMMFCTIAWLVACLLLLKLLYYSDLYVNLTVRVNRLCFKYYEYVSLYQERKEDCYEWNAPRSGESRHA